MITKRTFFRRTANKTLIVGTTPFDPRVALTLRIAGVSTPVLKLVDAQILIPDVYGMWWNVGVGSIAVQDNAGGLIGTIAPDEVHELFLVVNSTAAGIWKLKQRTFLT